MTEQSPFLSGLNAEKQFAADRMEKSLRSNKVLQQALENRRHAGEKLSSMRFSAILDVEEQRRV